MPCCERRTTGARIAAVFAGCMLATATTGTGCSVLHRDVTRMHAADATSGAGTPPMAKAAQPSDLFGKDWVFVEIPGLDAPLPSPPPIAGFQMTVEGHRLTGTTACNRMSSGYDVDFDRGTLHFVQVRNTRMLCDRVASDTEEAVLQAMIATDSFRIRDARLELYGRGRLVARLALPTP